MADPRTGLGGCRGTGAPGGCPWPPDGRPAGRLIHRCVLVGPGPQSPWITPVPGRGRPDDVPVDVERRLAELGGAARWRDLVGCAADDRRLRALVERGLVRSHGGGCYALPEAPDWLVRARQFNAALTCISWAAESGHFVLERPTRLHLAVPAGRSPSRSPHRPVRSAVLHRTSALRSGALPDPPVVTAPAAAAAILRCQPALLAMVAIDSFLNRSTCTAAEIAAQLRGPGSKHAKTLLGRCDARSDSGMETIARVVLRDAGLAVRCNVPVSGVGWVDLLVEDRVVVELDGFEHHGSRRVFAQDRRRDRALAALGFRVLRFTYDEVVHSPKVLLEEVLAALEAPWVPEPLRASDAARPGRRFRG